MIEVYPTRSKDELAIVLCHPEIWPLLSKRVNKPDRNLLPMGREIEYVMIAKDSLIIGCAMFEQLYGGVQFHPYVLPEYRDGNATEAVSKAIDYGFGIGEMLLADIPIEHDSVADFARFLGFLDIPQNSDKMMNKLRLGAKQWAA